MHFYFHLKVVKQVFIIKLEPTVQAMLAVLFIGLMVVTKQQH